MRPAALSFAMWLMIKNPASLAMQRVREATATEYPVVEAPCARLVGHAPRIAPVSAIAAPLWRY
jgi:hypothetical protein